MFGENILLKRRQNEDISRKKKSEGIDSYILQVDILEEIVSGVFMFCIMCGRFS